MPPVKPVKKEKTPEQALASLMRLSSRAEKCSGDARRLMYGWGIERSAQEKILAELISRKFIDDERYAAAYVREKVRFSGWGVHKIRAALAAKGIPRATIEDAVAILENAAEPDDRLEKYLNRKLTLIKAATPYELRTKLIRYGLSLGYDYDKVSGAVDKLRDANS